MARRIGIFGSSGMAREARDIAEALGWESFFVARDATEAQAFRDDAEVILEADMARHTQFSYVIGVGEGAVRQRIAQRHAHLSFTNLIHPSATFGRGQREQVEGCRGVMVCAGVRLTSGIRVGDFSLFNLNASVSHDCVIGAFSTISPQACVLGNVEIGEGAWIGAAAVIHQGRPGHRLSIGARTVIGAGAVVLQACEADAVYVGVPARKIA